MNRDEVEGLRRVAGEKILTILDALQIDYSERYQYVISACPIHGGDRGDAWSWHMDKEIWQCFSRGCHDKYNRDIFGLVMGVLDCGFPEAVKFISKLVLDKNTNLKELAQLQSSKQFVKKAKGENKPEIFPEECLGRLSYNDYLERRGYSKELVESYQIGETRDRYKAMSNRLIIPIRNLEGYIVGFTGRTLEPNWQVLKIPKWIHSKGFNSAYNLFNIANAAPHIKEQGRVILVEGPLDVLRLEQYNIKNSVALFGRKLHNQQITLLAKLGVDTIYVALDADNAGRSGAENAFNIAKSFFNVHNIDLGTGDVGDMDKERVMEVFNEIRI